MAIRLLPRVAYNGQLMAEDAASKGWGPRELASLANGALSQRTVYRFLSNEVQTVATATVLAGLLDKPVERYIVRSSSSAAPALAGRRQVPQSDQLVEAGACRAELSVPDDQLAQGSEDSSVEVVLHTEEPTELTARGEHESQGEVRGERTEEVRQ